MRISIAFFALLSALIISQAPASYAEAINEMDISGRQGYVSTGHALLCLDYMEIIDNHVQMEGPEYPNGRMWIIIYKPDPYAGKAHIWEKDWLRKDELNRFLIPGPSDNEAWANTDQGIYRNFGIYQWSQNNYGSVVYRVVVEKPAESLDVDTIMWGVINENDSYDGYLASDTDAKVIFRTADLPEYSAPPSTKVNKVVFVHGIVRADQPGMEVRVDFDIDNLRATSCRIAIFVHGADDDSPVKCLMDDTKYRTTDGFLTSQDNFTPLYNRSKFRDYPLFIPYSAFPITGEYAKCYAEVHILDSGGGSLAESRSDAFEVMHLE